ncbi:hypothetical protein LOB13_00990 [Lactobacillus delbrueckii subsp. lactis]|nr:Ada metal-binding domain-containing protein [Lactobacillus delbrueckii]MCD5504021.1 hypothetical protein [Lactobacillus delbrueckii subsp. lactis]
MDDNEMWQAVQTCDPAYDGEFFYAVQTTRIFCRPKTKICPFHLKAPASSKRSGSSSSRFLTGRPEATSSWLK